MYYYKVQERLNVIKVYGLHRSAYRLRYIWERYIYRTRPTHFLFQGKKLPYLYSVRNLAWLTERTLEVPLVLPFLTEAYANHKKVMEVGNVIRQYCPEFSHHDIVDKYEYRKGVINVDIIDLKPKVKYDLIVSISTMEHVGFYDPDEYDSDKILTAFRLFRDEFLAPNGVAVITMPIGFNPEVDKRLREHLFPFAKVYFMKRVSKNNHWEEATEEDAFSKKFNSPFNHANAVVLGITEANK